ncbi:hypothetical protein ATY81_23080 [Rhizobium sp. R72]|uniref:hypothetical protein n=1 Tax=unclassified Rhizobium TaxID=2613769 RepID=UPI000B52AED0|nr:MULTISPECIES: hypothetical protein [unclassified Rhizobium]OWV83415.1 hypothetical protein ATY79_12325 [Rhizobium sp. R693]OWW02161.1 hypothetical protein ATY81_23080 [Rhizobium sp. R72]OWW02279.1 hypothetical protein ATY80_23080 [Rhizobium sp. R711]
MKNTYLQRIQVLVSRSKSLTVMTSASRRPRFSDEEVHQIFGRTRCYYTFANGIRRVEADGIFVRYELSNEGSLGYVYRNPLNGENWLLWVIHRRKTQTLCACPCQLSLEAERTAPPLLTLSGDIIMAIRTSGAESAPETLTHKHKSSRQRWSPPNPNRP